MKYFFVLGRNPELSRAELFSFLSARDVSFEEVLFEDNLVILDLKKEFEFNVQKFGGLIGLGTLREFFDEKEMLTFLEKNEFVELDKFTYSLVGNVDSSIFSEKFKREKKKAQIRNAGKRLKFQSGERIFLPNVDVEIFSYSLKNKIFLGLVEQKFSSKEVEKRDMEKPVRRESLAISPRLSRILINISQANEKDFILDPFCGVGGIVQEAVLMGIDCLGIDQDSEAVGGAKENLNWLRENYSFQGKFELVRGNSLNAQNRQYDAIVAESSLGEVLRRKLSGKPAKAYLDDFTRHIVSLLRKFKEIKKPNAKIAITFPCFEKEQISKEEICEATGLRVVSVRDIEFPIIEKRDKQFVNRQIWVFY